MPKKTVPRIGIRLPNWATFARDVIPGIMDHVRLHQPWRLMMDIEASDELPVVRIDENWEGEGLIIFRPTASEAKAWKTKGIKVVNLSSEGPPGGVRVIPDNTAVGTMAARHLRSLGLRHFAYWDEPTRRYSQERGAAFRAELAAHGLECHPMGLAVSEMGPRHKWQRIRREMVRQLNLLPRPIGIFAKDETAAIGLVDACLEASLRVPQDVAVLGMGDDPCYCHLSSPPLSSVRYPGREIGRVAASLLDRMLQNRPQPPGETLIPPGPITVRESTQVLAFTDSVIINAVEIIRREAPTRPLQTLELIRRSGLSRSSFLNRFQKALGSTPKDEILRIRLEHARNLIAESRDTLKEIAGQMGFVRAEDLSRLLQKKGQVTSTQIRRGTG